MGGLEWRVGALRRYPSCDADKSDSPELPHSVERLTAMATSVTVGPRGVNLARRR